MSYPSGTFSPQWLYYEGQLWHQPTITLRQGQVLHFSPFQETEAHPVKGLLSPCWVNAHTHLELSHLRGRVPPGRGMVEFIQRMGPGRGSAPASVIYAALEEARQEGTCAFVSHQNVTLSPAAIPPGIVVRPLMEYFGLRERGARRRWRALRRADGQAPMTPHSFYSLSRSLLRRARRQTAFPRSIHFMESLEERLWLESGGGPFRDFFRRFVRYPRPVPWQAHLRRMLRRAPAVWLIHATEAPLPTMERLLARYSGLYVVLCPEANDYLFRRLPPMSFWQRHADRLLLGTDSLANSPSLSLWGVIQRLWMGGSRWEAILKAAVDNPRRWLQPPPAWVQVSPLSEKGELLPDSQPHLFTAGADR